MTESRLCAIVSIPLLAVLASALGPAAAQGIMGRKAPLSPRYRAWLAQHQPRGVPGPAGGGREGGMRTRGYIPPPIDLSHVQGPIFSQGVGDPVFDQGGNDWISTALLARGTGAANTFYECDLRTGVTDDPGSGVSVSGSAGLPPQMGTILAPGYHVVPLEHPVNVPKGTRFAVLLLLRTPGYLYLIPVQEAETGYSDLSAAEHGRSFISADGATWQDLSPDCKGAVACVKALAEPAGWAGRGVRCLASRGFRLRPGAVGLRRPTVA